MPAILEPSSTDHSRLDARVPRWNGKRVRSLTFYLDGGLGDFVLFSRLIEKAILRRKIPVCFVYGDGASVSAKRELLAFLLKQPWCKRAAHLVTHGDISQVPANVDAWTDYLSFLKLFDFKREFAANYLRWETTPTSNLRSLIGADDPAKPLIAFCGRTGGVLSDSGRSLKKHQIDKLILVVPNVHWINVHPIRVDLPGVFNWRGSIAELASILAATDLAVCVDTFSCHFAGVLGKRVLAIMPHRPAWFWDIEGLYPTLTQFRSNRWPGIDDAVDQTISAIHQLLTP